MNLPDFDLSYGIQYDYGNNLINFSRLHLITYIAT